MYYVIGSGPSGVLCALALLDQGAPVTMIDAGEECEPEKIAILEQLRAVLPEEWEGSLVDAIRGEYLLTKSGFPLKSVYDSYFPYALDEMSAWTQAGTHCVVSFAKGGLSNVWGGTMLPYRSEDFERWPITFDELKPHYAAVADTIGIAGSRDPLESIFPFYAPPLAAPKPSEQARIVLSWLSRNERALRASGIFFGQSRLALRTQDDGRGTGCKNCGLCLTGCPYSAIYESTHTLKQLLTRPKFKYVAGLVVERIDEPALDRVTITCRGINDSEKRSFVGRRVFLAAGVLSTLKIISKSFGVSDRTFSMHYHPYFLFPLVMFKNAPMVAHERLHTLCQIFIELFDSTVSRWPVHLQVSTYNEFMRQKLGTETGRLRIVRKTAENLLLGRLCAVQGYLNSHEAGPIAVRVSADPRGQEFTATLQGEVGPHTRAVISSVRRKLLKNSLRLGMVPLPFTLYLGRPGDGNHVGSVFPMRRDPKDFETDVLGIICGLRRTHIVDASVLPSLPAQTLTYTVMANAHRVGTYVAQADVHKGERE